MLVCKLAPIHRRQGNLPMMLVLGNCKMNRCLHLSTRILRVYIEALSEFSHVYQPDGFDDILVSQGCVLESGSYCGNSGQNTHSKDKGGHEEPLIALVQRSSQ